MTTPDANHTPRVLVIDDNAAIHEDFQKILGGQTPASGSLKDLEADLFGSPAKVPGRVRFRVDCASQGQEALAMVEKALAADDPYVMAFVDIRMPPGWDGVETIEHLWRVCPDLQAVICSAYSDYSWEDIFGRLGHSDSLLILKKPFETVEVLQLAHALSQKWAFGRQARLHLEDLQRMVEERTRKLQEQMMARASVQAALNVSEERFSKAFYFSPMPMAIQSCPEGCFLAVNASFVEMAGFAADQLLQHTSRELGLCGEDTSLEAAAVSGNRVRNHPCLLRRADGAVRNTILWAEPMTLETKSCLLLVAVDVTEQLKLEAELRQAQKLEIVGRLVASVAHEFNNVLTVIQGHASLLRAQAVKTKSPVDSIDRIIQASRRAASFTGQLLAFSRKQPLEFAEAHLSRIIGNMQKMLEASVGERYQLQFALTDGLPGGRFSEGCVEQILINLVLNARDAMPDGGRISVRTGFEVLSEADARRRPHAQAGQFITLSVCDDGCGIPRDLLARIFDPFFTTKEVGKGTGLGLSTVQGIVQQHSGWIDVTSEVGRGSTFKILFPAVGAADEGYIAAGETTASDAMAEPVRLRGRGEVVLLVEDEPIVREMAKATLEDGGYRVIEAGDGREALALWDRQSGAVNLLVTDMVMPNGVSGGMLAQTLQARCPGLPVICTSGYTPEYIERDLPANHNITFLPKPYLPDRLLDAVRRSLENNDATSNDNGASLAESAASA